MTLAKTVAAGAPFTTPRSHLMVFAWGVARVPLLSDEPPGASCVHAACAFERYGYGACCCQ